MAAISKVLSFVQEHLDEELTPRHLAQVACFSQHHFHRIFRAVVGESVMDHVRRLRLERAAFQLKADGGSSVGRIAFDAGYGAQEAFTRIFQAYFGMAPKTYRQEGVSHVIPAACGVHFGPRGFSPLRSVFVPSVMSDDNLCPFHREFPTLFEERWEELLAIMTAFSYDHSLRLKHPNWENETMNAIADIDKDIDALEEEVEAAKLRLIEARRKRPREEVQDYTFKDSEGREVRLSELFGDKDDLIVVHNMGTGCAYCTLWADGYIGIFPHLTDRAAFALSSPDTPDVQKRFAEKRNWPYRMISVAENSFAQDMGFYKEEGYWPGISTFIRDGGKIYRVGKAHLGPNDDFCAVWPFFDLLEGGPKNWAPKYQY